jgi:precorrin-6B methylase 2
VVAPSRHPRHLRAGDTSLANVAEIILALLDAAAVASVVEIGAFRGELTRDLLGWAEGRGARVAAVDPAPTQELLELAREHPELDLIRKTSFEALDGMPIPDAVIIDGDHNYYTVTGELQRIHRRGPDVVSPLVMLHDVGWPLARRDSYHDPERIPEESRQPLAPARDLSPEPSFAADRPFAHTADREGGPRNGGLTAVEDFIAGREGLRFALVPAFFGLGVLWPGDAPWATAVDEVVGPLDRHPVLERLEADRVVHLIAEQIYARRIGELQDRIKSREQREGM